jgi:hypothetical protein
MSIRTAAPLIVLLALTAGTAYLAPAEPEALSIGLAGQISEWHREARDGGERVYQTGMRYIPRLILDQPLGAVAFIDLEASLDSRVRNSRPEPGGEAEADLYRLKLRLATAQSETRIGLQKINFGPAQLLRPLQWFDSLDPRDPLGLTDGVWGLRFRYVTLSNASLWLWGLAGNEDPRGWELLASADDEVELGGRLQLPLPRGEGAVTFHRRTAKIPVLVPGPVPQDPGDPPVPPPPGLDRFTENRFALDGRWDVTIGLWLETVLQEQRYAPLERPWSKRIALGADYTLPLGNGLHLLAEHMTTALSRDAQGWDEELHISACSLNYPFGLSDHVRAIGYLDWDNEQYYQYLAWGRAWDDWLLDVSLFHYPETDAGDQLAEGPRYGSGYGGQVTVLINH